MDLLQITTKQIQKSDIVAVVSLRFNFDYCSSCFPLINCWFTDFAFLFV